MVDYDEYLLNLYVVDLAPVTSQDWFHTIIGGVAGGTTATMGASIIA